MEFFCYAYGRLSKEDLDKKAESDSIKNQRDLIHAYIDRDPELRLVMEGYDDGYTGTSFDRPHVREMLEAVKSGKVNCVIVKDLSRFGREYIESGQYIEKLFPALGVRFIAINDNYDTAHLDSSSSLMLPFKNLMNDSYCRDTSIKVHSKAKWSPKAVQRILENEVYLGVMTQGKRTTPNYKVKTVIERPPEDWMRVEGTHEAIISREGFQLAARLKGRDTRKAPGANEVYPLSGLVCCGDCKGNMVRKTTLYGDKTYGYFICAAHRADKSVCSTHSISEEKLERAVLEGINLHIRTVSCALRGCCSCCSCRKIL